MNDHVLASLVRRRTDMIGEIHTLQKRLYELQADLTALDAVIRQFDPEYELSKVRAHYRRQPTPGEQAGLSRSVLDLLRQSGAPCQRWLWRTALWQIGGWTWPTASWSGPCGSGWT